MSKVIKGLIVLSILVNISSAQQTVKFGMGFEFHTFPSAFIIGESNITTGVYFPMESKGYMLEPQISYNSTELEDVYDDSSDYKSTTTNLSLIVGISKLIVKDDLRINVGARFGKSWSSYEEEDEPDEDFEKIVLGPVLGAEYFIADNFSFGGECMYSITSSEDKEDGYSRKFTLTQMVPKFIVRFYFSE
mgnify:CR=1 FL=1